MPPAKKRKTVHKDDEEYPGDESADEEYPGDGSAEEKAIKWKLLTYEECVMLVEQ